MNFLKLYQKVDDAISYLFSSVCNERNLLKSNLKKKEIIFVDIGANVGNYVEFVNKIFKIKTLYCLTSSANGKSNDELGLAFSK